MIIICHTNFMCRIHFYVIEMKVSSGFRYQLPLETIVWIVTGSVSHVFAEILCLPPTSCLDYEPAWIFNVGFKSIIT